MTLTVTRDTFTPQLQRALAAARNKVPILRAMGMAAKSITEGNFSSLGSKYRPIPWKPKSDGTPSNLKKTTALSKSFHLDVTNEQATIWTDRPYAGVHQTGKKIEAKNAKALRFQIGGQWVTVQSVIIPPRPFFPITPEDRLTPEAAPVIEAAGLRAAQRQIEG